MWRMEQILRVVCDLPAPVRTAQTEITGLLETRVMRWLPMNRKSAPSDSTQEALCMSSVWEMSL